MEGGTDLEPHDPLRLGVLRELHQPLDRVLAARDDDLRRRVQIGERDRRSVRSLLAQLAEPGRVEADHGGHGARALALDLRHQAAAQADELHPVVDGERARGDRGRVLAEAVAGDEVGPHPVRVRGLREREREREEGGLRHRCVRERLLRALEAVAADGLSRRGVRMLQILLVQLRIGREQAAAHADLLRPLAGEEESQRAHPALLAFVRAGGTSAAGLQYRTRSGVRPRRA